MARYTRVIKKSRQYFKKRPITVLLVVSLFAVAGYVWLASSSAATYSASQEVEQGNLDGTANSVAVDDASDGSAVKFGAEGAQSGDILFEDDFSGAAGAAPDQSKWRDYGECAHEFQAFGGIRCAGKKVLTGQGQLSVQATPTLGSGLMTAGKYGVEYGEVSAWIKVPATTGYWPAFWTENRPSDFSTVPLYGEADIMEAYGFEPIYSHAGVHAWSPEDQVWGFGGDYCTLPDNAKFSDAYHKYSAKFAPDGLTFFIDDRQCGETVVKDDNQPWVFAPDIDRGSYLILDLAIGGADDRQPTPPRNDQMLVDRVEVRRL